MLNHVQINTWLLLMDLQEEGKKEVDGITWEKVGLKHRAIYDELIRNNQ